MMIYIRIIGHIKNHENFKILFWSWESEKTIFTIVPDFFTKNGPEIWELMTSETTWLPSWMPVSELEASLACGAFRAT